MLLFAAVHELVLADPTLDLARWYASVTGPEDLAGGDPWPVFRRTCLEHRAELEAAIGTRATQTNEVNRATLVAVLLAAAGADLVDVPVSLVELGASAGLLLGVDRFRVEVGGTVVGEVGSPVHCVAAVRGPTTPDLSTFPSVFADRIGLDQDPVALADKGRVRWLEACLWPDQPWRIERFRSAVARLRSDPPRVVAGDMIDDLPVLARSLEPDTHLMVFHTWALTYVAKDRRADLATVLERLAAAGRPVSWVSAEPPGAVPGIRPPDLTVGSEEVDPDTVLGLRCWRGGAEVEPRALGWAHPHGNWLAFTG